jgi:hypothetical protein
MESLKWAMVGGALVTIGCFIGFSASQVSASGAGIKESGAGTGLVVTSSTDGRQIYVWTGEIARPSTPKTVRCYDVENGLSWEKEVPAIPAKTDEATPETK